MHQINIYGEIGYQVLADDIRFQLENSTGDIEVNLSSPGGSVFEGFTIYNLLKNSKRVKVCNILGLCGSIATLIADGADKVKMSSIATYMIHNPSIYITGGDNKQLEKDLNALDNIKKIMKSHYANRSGQNEDVIDQWMNEEKYFTASEALQMGFIDEVLEVPMKAVATLYPKYKMKTEEQKSILNEIKEGFVSLKKLFKAEIQNMTLTLDNGQNIYVDGEELIGSSVYLVNEDGEKTEEPAPDGVHTLNDGRTITVSEGVITEATEAEPEEKKDEDMEALKNENASLKEQLAALEEAKNTATEKAENLEKDLNTIKEESQTQINDLNEKIEKLSNVVFGETGKPAHPTDTQKKEGKKEAHPLDAMAERMKSKYKLKTI